MVHCAPCLVIAFGVIVSLLWIVTLIKQTQRTRKELQHMQQDIKQLINSILDRIDTATTSAAERVKALFDDINNNYTTVTVEQQQELDKILSTLDSLGKTPESVGIAPESDGSSDDTGSTSTSASDPAVKPPAA
jgi:predicted PurR-regulated permease PerM